ncbi:predicted protein [Streptomyces iranensis]|uniref:Uncharacterized protein n=2 Tax=Streptomyces iranensis TaxID=576784 RepID=A0A061A3C5_9ACTN|nr:predicted protein [Streptomyces iranensis]
MIRSPRGLSPGRPMTKGADVDVDEQRRFDESVDDAEAASVGRARAAAGGRIELTVEELAEALGRPQPPASSAPGASGP